MPPPPPPDVLFLLVLALDLQSATFFPTCLFVLSGYFTIPMGFCDLILKEGGREMPIKTWKEMLEKQIPAATEYFPPAIGHHADDTWEHVRRAAFVCVALNVTLFACGSHGLLVNDAKRRVLGSE
jgi:hypothetical protein